MKPFINLLFVFICLLSFSASADIIPDPVKVKGIVPAQPVNIRMASEVVTVDLRKDSAYVHCVFNMENLGGKQDIEVGFPIMNFYLWNNPGYLSPVNKKYFQVYVRGHQLSQVDTYIPDTLKNFNYSHSQLHAYENANKPWYLWKMHFDKKEKLQIVVDYQLPNSGDKRSSFFTYLLSTGAGWAGTIGDAKVIVNLKDIPDDQVVASSPENDFSRKPAQLMWHFKDLEPTTADDIMIRYESVKGGYKAAVAKQPDYLIDGVVSNGMNGINPEAIETIKVVKNDPQHPNGLILIYTRLFLFNTFIEKIKSVNAALSERLKTEGPGTFYKDDALMINGVGAKEKGDGIIEIINKKITAAEWKLVGDKPTIILTAE